jgi:chromosome partitioning protein
LIVSRETFTSSWRPAGYIRPRPSGRLSLAYIVAVANQKGGVGKTTSALSLAAGLALAERRVLLVDFDPQANATSGIGLTDSAPSLTVYDALLDPTQASEVELVTLNNRELRLRRALGQIQHAYDYVIVDTPPSLGILTVNVLAAASHVIIPLQSEYYALEGLSQLLRTIDAVRQNLNADLSLTGVLLTMYDARLNLSRQVAADARKFFGDKVFDAIVPRNVRVAEAPSFGRPIILYDVASVGAQAYLAAAQELMSRLETHVSSHGLSVHSSTSPLP